MIRSIVVALATLCGWRLDAVATARNLKSKVVVITAPADTNVKGAAQFIHAYRKPLPQNVTDLTPGDLKAISDSISNN